MCIHDITTGSSLPSSTSPSTSGLNSTESQELLHHFKLVQRKHEKNRHLGIDKKGIICELINKFATIALLAMGRATSGRSRSSIQPPVSAPVSSATPITAISSVGSNNTPDPLPIRPNSTSNLSQFASSPASSTSTTRNIPDSRRDKNK